MSESYGCCGWYSANVIVHCAAERRPDVVERHPEAAENLNVHATGALAKEAGSDPLWEVESVAESAVTVLWPGVQQGAAESCVLDLPAEVPDYTGDVAAVLSTPAVLSLSPLLVSSPCVLSSWPLLVSSPRGMPLGPAFPGPPYQEYANQGYTPYQGGHAPYHGSPAPYQGHPAPYQGSPAPYTASHVPFQPGWEGTKVSQYQQASSNPNYMVGSEGHRSGRGRVTGMEACLGACWTAACCCCLLDMFR
ncbi:unnamed protein product [Boreogadus saida]